MHAALRRVYVVGEGDEYLVIAVVVLHGYLALGVLALAGHVYHVLVQCGLVPVYIGDELAYAAGVVHRVLLLQPGALVLRGDAQTRVQKRLLAHTGVQGVIVEFRDLEHLRVGVEAHHGAGAVGAADYRHALGYLAAGELHLIDLPVLVNADLQPVGERVDHAGADAVQSAGDLVSAAAELAAGVEHGVHDLQSRLAGLLLYVDGYASAVVGDADDVARLDGDLYVRAVPGQSLVYGVVDYLVHQVVETRCAGGADIHAGTHAHGLKPLQNLYFTCVVFLGYLLVNIRHSFASFTNFNVQSCGQAPRWRAGRGRSCSRRRPRRL